MSAIKEKYKSEYGKELEDDLRGDTSGDFSDLLLQLARGRRSQATGVDQTLAEEDAAKLHKVKYFILSCLNFLLKKCYQDLWNCLTHSCLWHSKTIMVISPLKKAIFSKNIWRRNVDQKQSSKFFLQIFFELWLFPELFSKVVKEYSRHERVNFGIRYKFKILEGDFLGHVWLIFLFCFFKMLFIWMVCWRLLGLFVLCRHEWGDIVTFLLLACVEYINSHMQQVLSLTNILLCRLSLWCEW